MSNHSIDVLIVGGGVIGCAIAYNLLKSDSNLNVTIVERDSTYVHSSTVLSDGNMRIQFNLRENIEMSLYGFSVLENFAEEMATAEHTLDIAHRKQGNLFTVDEAARESALEGLQRQQSMGCEVEWLEPDQIKDVYPLFDQSEAELKVVGATLGAKDGSMSPLDILMGYRRKAIALGTTIVEAEVQELIKEGNQIRGARLKSGEVLHANMVVNAAGAWAVPLVQTVGVDLPIKATKRQVYAIETEVNYENILPMILLPRGQFCFHEGGGHFIVGGAHPDDPATYDDFSWHKEQFESYLWEGFVQYLPAFDRLKVAQGWAGLYAINTFDGNAILGEWPELKGLFLANGFSGHGFQQSHAVGRYLAELILGNEPVLDLSTFSPQRILDNKPVFEGVGRLI